MTPRHADVAYVLEGIAGVRGVFAVSTRTHDFAVAVDRGGGVLAEVHYALLRVLTHEELQRVHVFHLDTPRFAQNGRALVLTEWDRAAARARVAEPAPRPPIVAWPLRRHHLRVLLVTEDRSFEPLVYAAFDSSAYCMPMADHVAAAALARSASFDLILCDAIRAFGTNGLLARLPLEQMEQVIVVAAPKHEEGARRRLMGDERLLVTPFTAQMLRERVLRRPALTMRVAAFAIGAEPPPIRRVLAVTEDPTVLTSVCAATDHQVVFERHAEVSAAAETDRHFGADFILCEARDVEELLEHLPRSSRRKVFAMVDGGVEHASLPARVRVVRRPLDAASLREPFRRGSVNAPREAPPTTAPATSPPSTPKPHTFTAVLLDAPADVEEALRRILPIDARYLTCRDALLSPFHVAFASSKAALADDSVLRDAGEKVIVLAPAPDVHWVKHSLASDGRPNVRVLALPIDDVLLSREIHREHPELALRVAIAESGPFPSKSRRAKERTRVLIVDDDITTQMLRAAASESDDIVLATTAMHAFEQVVSASVSLLVVSASMRSDGGEPIYRVLWRLQPELKARTILITDPDLGAPLSSVSSGHSRRIVRRPLSTQVVSKVIEDYRDDQIA